MIENKDEERVGSSAYDAAGETGLDPRLVPHVLDGIPPIGSAIESPGYSREDTDNWSYLFRRQMELLQGKAGEAYLEGVSTLGMSPNAIPSLAEMSARLESATGWRIARIPGLLHESDFFDLISERIFPSTDYIRGSAELDYTPAPDCFHDMFGHLPMLTEPAFADYYQLFGKASLSAKGMQRTQLERMHWFTVEFGLIRQPEGLRIFGAGILSSKNEVGHALDGGADVRSYSAGRVIEQEYDVWKLQPVLFALDSFEQLVSEFRRWTDEQGLL